jgi:hypothetical protein
VLSEDVSSRRIDLAEQDRMVTGGVETHLDPADAGEQTHDRQ